jgi:hypothetical protein
VSFACILLDKKKNIDEKIVIDRNIKKKEK